MEVNPINLPTSILQLPDDCLYIIFKNLSFSSDRESFGLTCRRWLHIQNSSRRSLQLQCSLLLLSHLSLTQPSTSISAFHLHKLLDRYPRLQSLSLSGCTELPDSGLSLLTNYGPKLRTLILDCCFAVTDHGLSVAAKACPFLTNVSLYRCDITDAGLETLSEHCSNLQDVNLSYCSLITDCGLQALSRNCPHLQAIDISHCRSVNGSGFQGCSPTLTYLEADSCKLEPEGIHAIFSGGGLEYLNISNLCSSIRGHGLATLGAQSISKLRILNFRLCRTIGDDAIVKISQECPFLEKWNLSLCHEVGVVGWEAIGLNCSNLERLHVNRCRNFNNQGLQAIREGCRRLKKLYLGRGGRLSPTAFEMFRLLRGDVQIMYNEVMCIAPEGMFYF